MKCLTSYSSVWSATGGHFIFFKRARVAFSLLHTKMLDHKKLLMRSIFKISTEGYNFDVKLNHTYYTMVLEKNETATYMCSQIKGNIFLFKIRLYIVFMVTYGSGTNVKSNVSGKHKIQIVCFAMLPKYQIYNYASPLKTLKSPVFDTASLI